MNAYSAMLVRNYQENSVNTASPVRLVILLYQGAIRALRLAERYFQDKDSVKAHSEILQTEKIILELINALNFQEGEEIARNLFRLYQFILEQCALLNEENAQKLLPGLVRILEGLKEAWQEIEKNEPRPANI
ncbi:MAG: flagellar export chaperone FliS [Candidatus Atribacteria bacterium]|nr:flagellar export chaperone FliS [Candidatus Atribacteria bacterium]